MTSVKFVAVALGALCLSAPAYAEEGKGLYGALGISAQVNADIKFDDTVPPLPAWTSPTDVIHQAQKVKTGAQFTGTFGYDFGLIRADVEVSVGKGAFGQQVSTTANGIALTPAQAASLCGGFTNCSFSGNTAVGTPEPNSLRNLSAIGSVWLDVPVGKKIQPYIGGGLGVTGFHIYDGGGYSWQRRFTWQLGAGAAIPISKRFSLTADYRYKHSNGFTHQWNFYEAAFPSRPVTSHQFGAGIRVRF